jgi:nucleotide-binding universal stress UspA family protein/nitrite reductase/ring-hydroxylating ferredoxin subunit
MPYQNIVVGTDGSETARIAERVAIELARVADARMTFVSAYQDASGEKRALEAVAAARRAADGEGVASEGEAVSSEPAAGITEIADRGDADLIVVGDVGMGGPKRFRLGGVADRVSHSMPCDLLIVRTTRRDASQPVRSYERVLMATDGSATADRATRVGADVARTVGADMTLVYVGDQAMGSIVLRDAAERLGVEELPLRILQGDPGDKIVELVDSEGHDLVVVGNKGMVGSLRFLLGAVPDKVSHLAPSDVLVVNTAARSLQDLEPNEGAVVHVDGKKVAAYRDASGDLVTLSPKCKHLGCTVGWNHRAKTWDCPCHGSRYDASGQVIRGPAQRSLDRVELNSPDG